MALGHSQGWPSPAVERSFPASLASDNDLVGHVTAPERTFNFLAARRFVVERFRLRRVSTCRSGARIRASPGYRRKRMRWKAWPRANALAQPIGIGTGQNRLLVTTDLAGRNASGLPPQILPLRHTGRTDLKRCCDRTNGLARVSPRQSIVTVCRSNSCPDDSPTRAAVAVCRAPVLVVMGISFTDLQRGHAAMNREWRCTDLQSLGRA